MNKTLHSQKNDSKKFVSFPRRDAMIIGAQIFMGLVLVILTSSFLSFILPHRVQTFLQNPNSLKSSIRLEKLSEYSASCRIELVESIPQNLSFTAGPFLRSTFDAWHALIKEAKHSIDIAAYKSSLRGKHVLNASLGGSFSKPGEMIYEAFKEAGIGRNIKIRMVENSPGKDKGDNEDGKSLERLGVLKRRPLNMKSIFGSGVMHSKFIVVDNRHFYLGSANLDWRSLNQKMELGVLVRDCPSLAVDLSSIFEIYWAVSEASNAEQFGATVNSHQHLAKTSTRQSLKFLSAGSSEVFLAASPKLLNQKNRTWDLEAIIDAIQKSKSDIRINVMDYFPIFLYSQKKRFWPPIDNALREAILRGVRVKIIAAALHSPKIGLRFLKSLKELENMPGAGSVDVKVFKVHTMEKIQTVIRRDRRTHKKFLVTDNTLIIGTSNWSGDYFDGFGTGVAIAIRQTSNDNNLKILPIIKQALDTFERDWRSEYAHDLETYLERCLESPAFYQSDPICEKEKDLKLVANPKIQNFTNNI